MLYTASKWFKGIWMLLSIVGSLLVNYNWLESKIIPDPCYYHTHEPSDILQWFYTFSSASNGHPEPSLLNLMLTIATGYWIGIKTVSVF